MPASEFRDGVERAVAGAFGSDDSAGGLPEVENGSPHAAARRDDSTTRMRAIVFMDGQNSGYYLRLFGHAPQTEARGLIRV